MRYYLLGGFLTIGLAIYWPQYFVSLKMGQAGVLATVFSSRGSNEWISKKSLTHQKPQKSLSLRMNESLATGTDGVMVLKFKQGAEIRLLPSSFITLIRKANSTLIALRKGEIEVIREGEPNSVLISQGGQDRPLQDYHTTSVDASLWIDAQTLDTVKSVTPINSSSESIHVSLEGEGSAPTPALDRSTIQSPVSESMGSSINLSSDPLSSISTKQVKNFESQIRSMISDRISRQKNHLFRCYSTLVQQANAKSEAPQGKINLHFSVNNQGKVEDLLVLNSEIKDPKFQTCLIQVIKRTDFQPFQGQKVSTLLPLRFDKNLE
jgi:TonB family protein